MPFVGTPNIQITKNTMGGATYYNKLVGDEDCIIYEHVRDMTKAPVARAYLRAGVQIDSVTIA